MRFRVICHDRTRLGELLLRRGLIRQGQLEAALALQRRTRRRLGEVLVAEGWLCTHRLRRVLRWQRALRALLGVLTLLVLPGVVLADTLRGEGPAAGLVALADAELGAISAQAGSLLHEGGRLPALPGLTVPGQGAGLALTDPLSLLAGLMRQALGIEADVVALAPLPLPDEVALQRDGSMTLRWAEFSAALALDNMRLGGAPVGDVVVATGAASTLAMAVTRR